MSGISNLLAVSRRSLIAICVAVVALFAVANLTAKNSSHPGTVSNVAFAAFVLGVLLIVLVGITTLIRSRRSRQS